MYQQGRALLVGLERAVSDEKAVRKAPAKDEEKPRARRNTPKR